MASNAGFRDEGLCTIQTLFRELPQAIGISRLSDGVLLEANAALAGLLGRPLDELIGTRMELAYVDLAQRDRVLAMARSQGQAVEPRLRVRAGDGTERVGEFRVGLAELGGEPVIVGIFADLTERYRAEEALRVQAQIIEQLQSAVVSTDLKGSITSWNRGAEQLTGVPASEALGRHVSFLHPDHQGADIQRELVEPLMAGHQLDMETELLRGNGERFWADLRLTVLRAADGEPNGLMGHFTDITDRHRAEEALRESEERWRAIAENPFDFVLMVDRAGTLRYVNRPPPGTRREELIGHATVYEYVDPRHHDRVGDALQAVFESGETTYFEAYSHATGDWYGNFTSPVRRGGEVVLAAMLGRNITEAKRAEVELTEAKSRLEEAERVGKIGSWHWNIVTNDLHWSDQVYRTFGLSPQSFAATYEAFLEAVDPADREAVDAAVRRALEHGEPYVIEHRIVRPDGSRRIVYEHAEVYRDAHGTPERMLGTVQDITARKEVEREVQRLNAELEQRVADRTAELAQANAELESFAYSVSHDLRAPLRAINGLSQAVLEDYAEHLPDEGQEWLERIQAAAGRMGMLIDELLELAKISRIELSRTHLDLAVLCREIAEELRQATGRDVEFTASGECWAEVDPALMRVALQNLLDNAWKYTGREVHPKVEIGCEEVDGEKAFYVRDNGVGFDPASADRLFGAFQRLHHPRDFDGTGIGLATVRRIVHRHGGKIWADSAPGRGAAFHFTVSKRAER